MNKALFAGWITLLIFGGIAIREWAYRSTHMHHSGPAGELVALGIAGVALAGVVIWALNWIAEHDRRENDRLADEWRRVRALEDSDPWND